MENTNKTITNKIRGEDLPTETITSKEFGLIKRALLRSENEWSIKASVSKDAAEKRCFERISEKYKKLHMKLDKKLEVKE